MLDPSATVFSRFQPFKGVFEVGQAMDWLGADFRCAWTLSEPLPRIDHSAGMPIPGLDEEFFEWLDVLDAVDQAGATFTMMELGAGYGRWGVRGGLAARQRGLPAQLIFVEGEPQHFQWLLECLAINHLADNADCINMLVSDDGKPALFYVRIFEDQNAQNWYGQSIAVLANPEATNRLYFGRPVLTKSGWDVIEMPTVRLSELLAGHCLVDLIDADLQGAEAEVFPEAMEAMTAKVKRVHIGTHSVAIEAQLRAVFTRAGWRNIWDFTCQQENATPFGPLWFGDGIQSWINPALA